MRFGRAGRVVVPGIKVENSVLQDGNVQGKERKGSEVTTELARQDLGIKI